MTRDGQSVLFDVQGRPWAKYYGDDSNIIEDGFDRAVRFRVLHADGTVTPIEWLDGVAPAAPGPGVMLVQDLEHARDFQVGPDGPGIRPFVVDEKAGTTQALDVPAEVTWWGPNVDEFLWGGSGCRVVWQQEGGEFASHDVTCRNPGLTVVPVVYWRYVDDWAAPGRLVLLEYTANGIPLVVHASLDYGQTWRRIAIADRNWDGTIVQNGTAIREALEQLG
jgi:hypothetical protein